MLMRLGCHNALVTLLKNREEPGQGACEFGEIWRKAGGLEQGGKQGATQGDTRWYKRRPGTLTCGEDLVPKFMQMRENFQEIHVACSIVACLPRRKLLTMTNQQAPGR